MRTPHLLSHMAAILFCLSSLSSAQPPEMLWSRTFGGEGQDCGNRLQQTSDGGYIITGWTTSYGDLGDACLIKTDADGRMLWRRTYGGNDDDGANSVQQTAEGGYILTGFTHSAPAAGYDLYLIKTDGQGFPVWTRTFGGSSDEEGCEVRQTADGGYIIAGYTSSFGLGYADVYLVKTDASGNLVWQRTFGDLGYDYGKSVQQTSDGGYIIAGSKNVISSLGDDLYLIKTDTGGNQVWQHTYGGSNDDYGYSVLQELDGGYAVAGYSTSFGSNNQAYLVRVDSLGTLLWQRTYGGANDDYSYEVRPTADGGYLLAGSTTSFGAGGYDLYLIKTDSAGLQLWQGVYGGSGWDQGRSALQATDGGYALVGQTLSYGAGSYDIYLVKTDTAGASPLNIVLTPMNPPILVPAPGGSFQFKIMVVNFGPQNPIWAWASIRYPDGTTTPPTIGPIQLLPPVGVQLSRLFTQSVPGAWPAGTYTYLGYAHDSFVLDSSSFTFVKSEVEDGNPWITEASCTGEPFPGEPSPRASIPSGLDLGISPNPFNPTTALSYQLPATSHVSLRVYNTAGRLVATLVDEMQAAGQHRVTFDGSGLASGIYLVKLAAGGQTISQKVVLVK